MKHPLPISTILSQPSCASYSKAKCTSQLVCSLTTLRRQRATGLALWSRRGGVVKQTLALALRESLSSLGLAVRFLGGWCPIHQRGREKQSDLLLASTLIKVCLLDFLSFEYHQSCNQYCPCFNVCVMQLVTQRVTQP